MTQKGSNKVEVQRKSEKKRAVQLNLIYVLMKVSFVQMFSGLSIIEQLPGVMLLLIGNHVNLDR